MRDALVQQIYWSLLALFVVLFANGITATTTGPAGSDLGMEVEFKAKCPARSVPGNNATNVFKIGQPAKCVVSIINHSQTAYRVTGISGAIVSPTNFSKVLYNLTASRYIVNIKVNQEATIPFTFIPNIDPAEFGLVLTVEYADEDERARLGTGFQGVVRFTSPDSIFDFQSIVTFLVLIAVMGYMVKYTLKSFAAPSAPVAKKGGKRSSVPADAAISSPSNVGSTNSLDLEWIPAHLTQQSRNKNKKK